jgi:hypothetical protein
MKTPAEIYRDRPLKDPKTPADTNRRAGGGAEAAAERVRDAERKRPLGRPLSD